MATLTVEGVPPALLIRLGNVAVANGRCVNSEVILSLVRHVQAGPARNGAATEAPILCPLVPWVRAEVPPGLNVSWGDPG